MPNETIGYSQENLAKLPIVRENIVEIKTPILNPNEQFLAKLPPDLTPEEIEILDLIANQ